MDKEKLLAFVETLIDLLTIKKVVLLTLLIATSLVLFSLFENREAILQAAISPAPSTQELPTWELSELSKKAMVDLTKHSAVTYIGIADVDLKKNRRSTKWRYIADPELRADTAAIIASVMPQAVFDYDSKNTAQMVAVLSNEFRCDKTADTFYTRFYPNAPARVPTICRLAIPPFVGQFVGYIVIGIGREVSKQELDSIRLETARIAVDIYLMDVIKKIPEDSSQRP